MAALARDAEMDAPTLRRLEWVSGRDDVPDLRLGLRLANVLDLDLEPYRLAFGTGPPLTSESPRMGAWLAANEARAAVGEVQRIGGERVVEWKVRRRDRA